ncbi:MAG: deoxyribose-phosphate aldolase [Phototrophicaceae bacterium]|jgi:deoxyribose-phosphate aldolase
MAEPNLLQMIDHTLLKPEATAPQIETLCAEAITYGFAAVCVNSVYVPLAYQLLKDSPVKVCTVVGFPLGANLTAVKVFEAERAIEQGAKEIDMVIHIGALKARNLQALHHDIAAVVLACHASDNILCKVIIETALLNDEEKTLACQIAKEANADFVKTSTGFSTHGATPADVRLMRSVVGDGVGVKAAGGVRSLADAYAMIEAGANRLGTSAGVALAKALLGEQATPNASGY